MHSRPFWVGAAVAFIALSFRGSSVAAQTVALHGVTIVDVSDGSLQADQTVLVQGDRIAAVGPEALVDVPAEAVVLEGGYLIPGLWDMHVHATWPLWIRTFYPLLLANGVTGVRDMGGLRRAADAAARAIHAGQRVGPPRVVVAGGIVEGPQPIQPRSLIVSTPEEGREIVDFLAGIGEPFVKVYTSLPPETYLAIAAQSRSRGIPFAGHVPAEVRAADASDAGQRSMEHLYGVLEGCSTAEDAILAEYGRAMTAVAQGDTTLSRQIAIAARRSHALRTQDDSLCRGLAERFVRNETWQVPTLVTLRGQAYMRELAEQGSDLLRYLPRTMTTAWSPESNPTRRSFSEDRWATEREWHQRDRQLVRLMGEVGVPFLAGTDAPNSWAFPGFGLHDELELMVEAGLTPLQALQSATLNPARFLDRTNELGSVTEGKLADLVLLGANPLENIANTRGIRAVIANGRLFRRTDLDSILANVEAEISLTSIAVPVYEVLERDGSEAARARFLELREAAPATIRFGEYELLVFGLGLLGQGRIDQAIALLEMNTEFYPGIPEAFSTLGDALRAAGRLEDARSAYSSAVDLAQAQEDASLFIYRRQLASVSRDPLREH